MKKHFTTSYPTRLALASLTVLACWLGHNLPSAQAAPGSWTRKADMPMSMSLCAGCAVDGILYVAGGDAQLQPPSPLQTLFAYDPKTNAWTQKQDMPTPRYMAAAGAVNGIIYVVGGNGLSYPVTDVVEAYDPKTDTWTTKASLSSPRSLVTVCALEGILYAIGGYNASWRAVATVEAYDPATDQWTPKASLPAANGRGVAQAVDGIIYAFFNKGTFAYNPGSNQWTRLADIPAWTLNSAASVSGVVSNIVYLFGGFSYNDRTPYDFTLAYDPAHTNFFAKQPMPVTCEGPNCASTRAYAAGAVIDGKVYIAGGVNASPAVDPGAFNYSSTWMFDPEGGVVPPGTVALAAAGYSVAEADAQLVVRVVAAGPLDPGATVDYATADLTATAGLHYTAVAGTLTFAAGETNQAFVVPILNEGYVEGAKTFQISLSNPRGGAVLGTPATATVSITDNDYGLQFAYASYSVAEDAGAVLIGVVRGDDGILPVTLDMATTDLTATNGLDYTGITTTISFGPTERVKLVSIPILNDSLKEANKTFRIALSNPTGATLGSAKTTTVTIVDNDQGFQFELASSTVAEDAGAALIRVLRGSDENFPGTVDYATADVTATNGLDYTATHGTLSFAPGEKVKVIPIPILNDGVKEASKSFLVTLSNPTGGAVLGARTTTTVTIQDNDPGLGFELGSYSVCEKDKAGQIALTVIRGNDGALGPITVDYATADVTAMAGQDYQAVSGTLAFRENETLKRLTIPILQDAVAEGAETFRVTLSNPTGGVTLATATTIVTIKDNDYTVAAPADSRLAIRRDRDVNILTWTGDGQLHRADRVEGPWQTLAAARSPYNVRSPVPGAFYQVRSPRPATLYVPSSYNGQTPMPLMILLHGLNGTGEEVEAYVQLRPLAAERGFLYCTPNASTTPQGDRAWQWPYWNNETDVSAFLVPQGIPYLDEVGYLRGLIEEIATHFAVDRKRVYVLGYSNGAFMAYRMAYEAADLVAGIVGLAAVTRIDGPDFLPSEPVNILHVHGTSDKFYTSYAVPGGTLLLGAVRSTQIWAGYNGAHDPVTDPAPTMDLDLALPGLDTVVTRYTSHPPGGAVELWTINGGSHHPALSSEFSPRVIDWLLAHPKP